MTRGCAESPSSSGSAAATPRGPCSHKSGAPDPPPKTRQLRPLARRMVSLVSMGSREGQGLRHGGLGDGVARPPFVFPVGEAVAQPRDDFLGEAAGVVERGV